MTEKSGNVTVDRVGSTAVIVLDNPNRRNAIDLEMRHRLSDAVSAIAESVDIRAIILTGAGGVFSAGGDLSSKFESGRHNRDRMHAANDAIRAVAQCPKPVIAAVDGFAYGIGLSLAVACDLIVSTRTAKFCAPFSGVGLSADGGLHHLLAHRVGVARARRMILTGESLDALAAHAWGLVDYVATGESLNFALELAAKFVDRAPLSIVATKRIMMNPSASLDEILDSELAVQVQLMDSADFEEGREAFFAKRAPRFSGT